MEVTLYNFSKRENSTKQPSGGTTISGVRLKTDTSLYSPSIEFSTDISNYNYMKWDNRYYYINDVTYSNGLYIANCEIDVLATWKPQIGSTSCFIKYASSGYDIGLVDDRLSTNDSVIIKSAETTLFDGYPDGYVVGYIGEQGSSSPVVGLTESQLVSLQNAIQSSAFAELLNNPENALSKILSDCGSAITSCRYVPKIGIGGNKNVVLAGGYDTGIVGKEVDTVLPNTKNLDIPWNFPNGDFRNRSQFTTLLIYLPGYGYAQLNTDDFVGKDSVVVNAVLDSTVGVIAYEVGGVFKAEADISTPVQISTVTQGNALSSIVSGMATVGGIASGNIGVAVGGLFGAITSAMQTNTGAQGSLGSHSAWNLNTSIEIKVISHDTNVDPSTLVEVVGRPKKTISSPSNGYNECVNASVNCNAPQSLKDRINSYMNGGFYYE